ncbi:MAG: LysR substrate-binding domain-containing protein [Pseudomonadota bacterium]
MTKPRDHSLRVFEAAARHGSFVAAAEELGMTRAAISYQIRLLEAQRQISLFERVGNRVRPTHAGSTLAMRLAQAYRLVDDAVDDATTPARRTLRISAVANLGHGWLLPRLRHFKEQYPEINIQLDTALSLSNLTSDGIDIAIRDGYGDYPGLDARPLMPLAIGALAHRDLLAAFDGDEKRVLASASLYALHRKDWTLWARTARLEGQIVRDNEPVLWDCWNLVGQTALAGLGVALAPAILYSDALTSGELSVLRHTLASLQHEYWIVSRPEHRDDSLVAAFIAWLAAQGDASKLAMQKLAFTIQQP